MALSNFYTDRTYALFDSSTGIFSAILTDTIDALYPSTNMEFDTTILLNNGSTSEILNKGSLDNQYLVWHREIDDGPKKNNKGVMPIEYLGACISTVPNDSTIDYFCLTDRTTNGQFDGSGYLIRSDWNKVKNIRFLLNLIPPHRTSYAPNVFDPYNWAELPDTKYDFTGCVITPTYFYTNNIDNYNVEKRTNDYTVVETAINGNSTKQFYTTTYDLRLTNYRDSMADGDSLTTKQFGAIWFVFRVNGKVFFCRHPENLPFRANIHFNMFIPLYIDGELINQKLTIGDIPMPDDYTEKWLLPANDEIKGFSFRPATSTSFGGTYFITNLCAAYLVNSVGLRWTNVANINLNNAKTFRDNVRLGVMYTDGIISHTEWLSGETAIQRSNNPNKTTSYDTVPERPGGGGGGGGDTDDEKPEYGGAAWLGLESVSIDSGMYYRDMSQANLFIFKNIIKNLKDYEQAHANYIENARALDIKDNIAAENWSKTFPTPADYAAYIYDRYGYGSDPINSISSLIAFPFDLKSEGSEAINDIGAEDLYISVPVGIAGSDDIVYRDVIFYKKASVGPFSLYKYPKITKNSYRFNLVNNIKIKHPKGYTDFRAYAPYTRLELYIPMHGTIDLDPAVVIDQAITVSIAVTIADGSSVATVIINDSVYQTINGQVGYPIPLSAEASSTNQLALTTLSAQSQSQKLNAVGNVIHGLSSAVGSIATGNYGSAAGSVVDTLLSGQQNSINSRATKYQIEHATDGKIVIGQPSSLNAFLVHPKCQLIWHLPLMQGYDPAIYGKTVGYKCHKTTTLGALTGYTECSNANLSSVSCTEAEKTMILEQLKNGIIIRKT